MFRKKSLQNTQDKKIKSLKRSAHLNHIRGVQKNSKERGETKVGGEVNIEKNKLVKSFTKFPKGGGGGRVKDRRPPLYACSKKEEEMNI